MKRFILTSRTLTFPNYETAIFAADDKDYVGKIEQVFSAVPCEAPAKPAEPADKFCIRRGEVVYANRVGWIKCV